MVGVVPQESLASPVGLDLEIGRPMDGVALDQESLVRVAVDLDLVIGRPMDGVDLDPVSLVRVAVDLDLVTLG